MGLNKAVLSPVVNKCANYVRAPLSAARMPKINPQKLNYCSGLESDTFELTAQSIMQKNTLGLDYELSPLAIKTIKTILDMAQSKINTAEIQKEQLFKIFEYTKEKYLQSLLKKLTPDKAAIIASTAKIQPTALELEALSNYKNLCAINSALSNREIISESLKKEIDTLSEFIQKQALPAKTTVYRLENYFPDICIESKNGFGCLNSYMIEGQSISKLMENIDKTDDIVLKEKLFNELRKKILKSKIPIINEKFMSTFFVDEVKPTKNKLVWKLELPKGLQATYINGFVNKNTGSEIELLIQRNSKITITDIQYDAPKNSWFITATVNNGL